MSKVATNEGLKWPKFSLLPGSSTGSSLPRSGMRLTGALAALILVSSCGCTLSKEPPLRSESQEECRQGPVNQTFRGELQGLVFQNVFLEELDGDEDVSRAAVSRQVTEGTADAPVQMHPGLFWQVLSARHVRPVYAIKSWQPPIIITSVHAHRACCSLGSKSRTL